jgi:hypothetical protein
MRGNELGTDAVTHSSANASRKAVNFTPQEGARERGIIAEGRTSIRLTVGTKHQDHRHSPAWALDLRRRRLR